MACEDDPFSYRPMVKVARSESSVAESPGNKSTVRPRTSTPKGKRDIRRLTTLTLPEFLARTGQTSSSARRTRCPTCQIPLELLAATDRFAHRNLCRESHSSKLPLCSDNWDCNSRDVKHYYIFGHTRPKVNENDVSFNALGVRSLGRSFLSDEDSVGNNKNDTFVRDRKGRKRRSNDEFDPENLKRVDDDYFNEEPLSLSSTIVAKLVVDQGGKEEQHKKQIGSQKDKEIVDESDEEQEYEERDEEPLSGNEEAAVERECGQQLIEDDEWQDAEQDGQEKEQDEHVECMEQLVSPRPIFSSESNDEEGNNSNNNSSSVDSKSTNLASLPKDKVVLEAVGDSDSLHLNFDFATSQGVRLKQLNVKIAPKQVFTKPIVARGRIVHDLPTTMTTSKMSREEAGKQFNRIFAKGKELQAQKQNDTQPTQSSYVVNRTCPFYKRIPGTNFVVDAFNYGEVEGVNTYFLSHFHYDHFVGLTKHFRHLIVCSQITGRLLALRIKVQPRLLRPLPLNNPTVIENVQVTLLEANHCPGAVMFLFKCLSGQVYLHCGDFRYHEDMSNCSFLTSVNVDKVFLDTTYCKKEYDFPSQSKVIERAQQLVASFIKGRKRTLVLCGSYTIGKERIFIAIAEALQTKVYAFKRDKRVIMDALKWDRLNGVLTDQKYLANLHVVDMFVARNEDPAFDYLKKIGFGKNVDTILSIVPTGWTHSKGCTAENSLKSMSIRRCGRRAHNFYMLEVPYSEHSSFSELRAFVKVLKLQRAEQVVPTVNVRDAHNMRRTFDEWIKDKRNCNRQMIEFFSKDR